jgi:F0F1-type ATP synthase assembly protein I
MTLMTSMTRMAPLAERKKKGVLYGVLKAECVLGIALIGVGFYFNGPWAALSMGLGGLSMGLPQLYFGRIFFKLSCVQDAPKIVSRLFWAESVKILLSVGILALLLSMPGIQKGFLLLGYCVMQFSVFLYPLFQTSISGKAL